MKLLHVQLSIIIILLIWISIQLTSNVVASKRFESVSIDAVGGYPIHGNAVPVKER